ncbi:MerR family transcriptional regulator [Lentilactobacillus kefiri]|uniref:Transcriptional regulator, MerR family n=2 Tax=Lentilactobacillus kefiri TaxID=33962 RepID=A0A8E1RI98_LENKE|nr:MerR family transcriptional regulator [Lentilactobacillus kefiri]KRL73677.1 transcriptional regulator, MerR family [Lentilactobacillus parakefiri DSM 10551]KRM49781.1 transcriptional regulator, MerR family [Lentilactobacillus kefiri DSM 20587 = JCM 5818]MCJ2161577.1 MerR family transcriptional regulator [Lentilactobacillus kefiri]MCP9368166.1 MerR family transcriptional regulator [Lentilactobacillus kefiri]MDH5108232.1 MerR family transcriptional regulator [Lentilactobacillus kefiri]
MSTYTTGEFAKLGGVSVRTIQYYDQKGILNPTTISEGGRRLYTDKELKTLRLILLLKSMGLPLATIKNLLLEEDSTQVLSLMLTEQEKKLQHEMTLNSEQLKTIRKVQESLDDYALISQTDLDGIENIMESKPKLRRFRGWMITWGLMMDVLEVAAIVIWIMSGNWVPAAIVFPLVIVMAIVVIWQYYVKVEYICPNCHQHFKPSWKDFTFSKHTPNTRRLTCPNCGYRGYCVEVYDVKQIN